MFLSASEIKACVDSGEIIIEPFVETHLKPSSYVLQLSNKWRTWLPSDEPVDLLSSLDAKNHISAITTSDEYILSNTDFCLATTIEKLSLPSHLAGIVTPLSHIARWGLAVGLGSSLVSPLFGKTTPTALTLELASHNPSQLKLISGLPICHLAFIRVGPENKSYLLQKSVYEGQEVPSGPLLNEEYVVMQGEGTDGQEQN